MAILGQAAFASLMLLAGAVGARADYYEVTDLDLARHKRPAAVHQAAVASCGRATRVDERKPDSPAFKACMLRRGYRPQGEHMVHTEPPPGGLNGTYIYDDAAPGPERSDAEEGAASRTCERGAVIGTAAFNACMLAKNWRFGGFEPAGKYKSVCRVEDPTGTPLNVRSDPAGNLVRATSIEGTLVAILDSRLDRQGRKWASIANYPSGVKLGWVFQRYLSCF